MNNKVKKIIDCSIIITLALSIIILLSISLINNKEDNITEPEEVLAQEPVGDNNTYKIILNKIKKSNGIVNLRTDSDSMTLVFNNNNEVFCTKPDTYYVYLNTKQAVTYGVTDELESGYSIINNSIDPLTQLSNDIDNNKALIGHKGFIGEVGKTLTSITYEKDNKEYCVDIEEYSKISNSVLVTYSEVKDNKKYVIFTFNGYKTGNQWSLNDSWYKDDTDKEELLIDLIKQMDTMSQDILKSRYLTMNITVQQYKDNNYDNEVYQQLMREIGDLGYNVPYKEFKEFLDNNIKNNKKEIQTSILEYSIHITRQFNKEE